jgi:hypothetical protein
MTPHFERIVVTLALLTLGAAFEWQGQRGSAVFIACLWLAYLWKGQA